MINAKVIFVIAGFVMLTSYQEFVPKKVLFKPLPHQKISDPDDLLRIQRKALINENRCGIQSYVETSQEIKNLVAE